jgi:hypothetical protein
MSDAEDGRLMKVRRSSQLPFDLDEFEAARRDPRTRRTLAAAAAEGERIEREGRKRW